MTAHIQANLATAPAEIILNILGHLKELGDWFALAITCRRISHFIVAELDKYNVSKEGQYYALWYACVLNKPAILLHQIAQDAAVVNHRFTGSFRPKKIKPVNLYSKRKSLPVHGMFGEGMTPLSVAILAGRNAIVKLLLANGADPNLSDLKPASLNRSSWYPIQWAVASKYEGSVAIIRMLGAHSAHLGRLPACFPKDTSGVFRVMRDAPILSVLTLQKPQWNGPCKRQTSCEEFNDDLRRLQGLRLRQLAALLQRGADPNWRCGCDAVTPVFLLLSNLAIYEPSFYFEKSLTLSHEEDEQAKVVNEIVVSFLDMLRDFGVHIHELGNIYDYRGPIAGEVAAGDPETPLHAACRLKDRHKPIINWFLRNGLSINSLSSTQSTPLMAYCQATFTDMDLFREFLGNGPAINHSDNFGRTALHYLCANQALRPQVKEKAVKMLLDRGADPTLRNNKGYVSAEELDGDNPNTSQKSHHKDTHKSLHTDLLTLLEAATKAWNEKIRKQKKKEQERGDEVCLDLVSVGTKDERSSDRCSGRYRRRANCEGDRRQKLEDGHGEKQKTREAGNPPGSRGHARPTTRRSNRGDRRGNRDGNQGSNHDSTQHRNSNANGQGKGRRVNSHNYRDGSTVVTSAYTSDQSARPLLGVSYRKHRDDRRRGDIQAVT